MLLKDRIAIVTGAGSGIGQAGALAMAREGAIVVASDIHTDGAEQTVRLIREAGGQARPSTTDAGDDNQLSDLIDGTIREFGRLDILHSHAGVQREGTLEQVAPQDMDDSWKLNVRAHFMAARLAMPQMKAQGAGSIIITASNSGVQYDSEMIAYATTKHAVVAMVKQVAKDYARFNVRVNALCPGFIDTPFNAGFEVQMGGRDKLESYIAEQIPMGRFGTVEEMADAILFLASDQSSFMTGHALVIDGGECL